jgi:hypothetical protein
LGGKFLQFKGPSKLLKDFGPKNHLYIGKREEFFFKKGLCKNGKWRNAS